MSLSCKGCHERAVADYRFRAPAELPAPLPPVQRDGRGRCLVATRAFSPGALLLCNTLIPLTALRAVSTGAAPFAAVCFRICHRTPPSSAAAQNRRAPPACRLAAGTLLLEMPPYAAVTTDESTCDACGARSCPPPPLRRKHTGVVLLCWPSGAAPVGAGTCHEALKRCTACRAVRYCSVACQARFLGRKRDKGTPALHAPSFQ